MENKIQVKPGQRILFVCYGNTCRSPMAEGLAKKKLDHGIVVESAGIASGFSRAQPEAVQVMKDLFDVDISCHQARNLVDMEADKFDWIIVLDRFVFENLKKWWPWSGSILHLWDIEDPFGRDTQAYRNSARNIQRYFEKYLF
jgi:protein-tyrosine-phosphatase